MGLYYLHLVACNCVAGTSTCLQSALQNYRKSFFSIVYTPGDARHAEGLVHFDGSTDERCIHINRTRISYSRGLERFRDTFSVVSIANINLSENWGLMGLMRPESNTPEVSCNFGDLLAKMEELPRPATAGIAIEVAVIAMSTTAHITGSQRDCSSSTHLEPTRISDQFEITALGT